VKAKKLRQSVLQDDVHVQPHSIGRFSHIQAYVSTKSRMRCEMLKNAL